MIKVIKQEMEIEESPNTSIIIICDFFNTTKGSIKNVDKTN